MSSTLATTIQNGSKVVIGIPLKISARCAYQIKRLMEYYEEQGKRRHYTAKQNTLLS